MKRFTGIAITVAIIGCTGITLASNWATFDTVMEGNCTTVIRMDTASWTHSGHMVTAWDSDRSGPTKAACPGYEYKEMRSLVTYDCQNRTSKLLEGWSESWGGKFKSYTFTYEETPWVQIVPDTAGDTEFEFACSHNPDRDMP